MSNQVVDLRVPVSVITGFLGAGKSTLLNRLLRHPDMGETAVIVNEFGEIGLDHALIASSSEDTVLLASGCLCCTVRGDLVNTLRELMGKRERGEVKPFKRVVIETTGLADPAPVLHTLMTDPVVSERFRLESVITLVDAVNGSSTLDNHAEAVKQAAMADRIVLSKTDLAAPAVTAELKHRLRHLNPAAPILPAVLGEIEPGPLFNAGLYDPTTKSFNAQNWLRAEAYGGHDHDHHHHDHDHDHDHHHHDHHDHGHHDHGHEHHGHDSHGHPLTPDGKLDVNRHDNSISSFCITFDEPFEWNILATWLDMLAAYRGDNLLRVKGLMNVQGVDRPVVVHGVQHLFHPPATIPAWPDADHRSRIVFITRDLDRAIIENTLVALKESTPAPQQAAS
ncbi:GTP-binding protein [Ferrovibrio sp.]|uniref:CobW family GTP-binding protein n=1 Tax=Ferrovibrio sp. TaxID=1917215 RepID=UPI0025BDA43F|nr:GTP-binding protein [Ferrovibrio sp.]MBX3453369.1 GTP-binding protein [Ferrovibrio sp.]